MAAITAIINHDHTDSILKELDRLLCTGITDATNQLFDLALQNPMYSMPNAEDDFDDDSVGPLLNIIGFINADAEFDTLWRDHNAQQRRTDKNRKISIKDAKGKPGTLKTQKNDHPKKTKDKRARNARRAAVRDHEFRTATNFHGYGDEDHYYSYLDHLDRLDRHLSSLHYQDNEDLGAEDFHDNNECDRYLDCFFCTHYGCPEYPC